jgi:2',3'-cyclic-nucleotide 2'-phosphodiesterase (5'-nucleotidase family)
VNAAKPDAIVLAGHMGLTRRDDYANRIGALTREFPHLVACIGGHTHQNHSSDMVNNVLYTQADHFGIYAGKVDLIFDRTSRRLLQREAVTVRMDHQIPLDALVLSLAQADLGAADRVMAREMGELTARFDIVQHNGGPSDVERLIGSAMISALREQGTEVDFVAHGLFDDKHPMLPGMKTIADAWAVLPYENEMVTFEASHDDLVALAADFSSGREIRHLMKVQEKNGPSGAVFDAALPLKAAYRIAVNSYDSQSGGQRFPVLAKMVADPAHHRVLHRLQTRDALIAFFLARRKVGITSLLV